MPDRIAKLPISDKGFPIPEFVAWLDLAKQNYLPRGTYGAVRDFRVIDPIYMDRCFRFGFCWICGERLGVHRVFAIGPMCAVSRTTMEPPSHRDCVEYAARACPFIARPRMRRNDQELPDQYSQPGIAILRNPGVYLLWETQSFRRWRAPQGQDEGLLCTLGKPVRVDWWREGRRATRLEALEAIDSGMPILRDIAVKEGPEAVAQLEKQRAAVDALLPPLTGRAFP